MKRIYWLATVEVLFAFGLADAAVIAWYSRLMTGTQLVACALAYILVAFGAFVTYLLLGREV